MTLLLRAPDPRESPSYPPAYPWAEVSHRLRVARTVRKWTQEELARVAFVDVDTVRSIEAARRKPLADTLILLADALNVSLDWLLGRRGNRWRVE